MASSPSELTLDCKPHTTYSMLLKPSGDHQNIDQTQKLKEVLSRLQEERLKIEAFKRELPLCIQLLTNAVEASKQQLQTYEGNEGPRAVLEEFIPLKNSNSESNSESKSTQNVCDKANWMTSAQLWSQQGNETSIKTISPKELRNGGPFLPFSKDRNSCPPHLYLASSSSFNNNNNNIKDKKNSVIDNENGLEQDKGSCEGQTATANTISSSNQQPHRKARRCWSPELHRRFVNALHMLGGSQVATPKQIKELMKVDGLTNDEVKSHLQKYRLHTRRPSPSPHAAAGGGAPTPQLVVLGGIWVPPEYATASAATAAAPAQYGAYHHYPASPHPPTHFCASPMHQEFYNAAAAPPPAQFNPQLHMYNAIAEAPHRSPESDVRGGGDRSESIEDGKSESRSGGSGERKGLGALRLEEGEESNGSEITLKF